MCYILRFLKYVNWTEYATNKTYVQEHDVRKESDS